MKQILLIGGGGHCRSCIDVVEAEKRFEILGIVQPELTEGEQVFGYSVVGVDEDLPQLLLQANDVLITIGQIKSPEIRKRLYQQLISLNANFPTIKSPLAYCSEHAVVGNGTILMHGAVINAGSQIGNNCIVNSMALIEHDAVIADHCHISTGAIVNGGVTICEGCFVGSGAVLREGITLGKNVVIGAGQIVLADVPDKIVMRSTNG